MTTSINSTAIIYNDGTYQTSANSVTNVNSLGTGDSIYIGTGNNWAIHTAVYDRNYITNVTELDAIRFSSDGTKMYALDSGPNQIRQYGLSTAWDVTTSTLTYSGAAIANLNIGGIGTISLPYGLTFKPDGTILYIIDSSTDKIYQYSVSPAWAVNSSSITYVSNLSISSYETSPTGIDISSDGSKIYILGQSSDKIHQYNLSTPWTLSSATYSTNLSILTYDTSSSDIKFKTDGTRMYFLGNANDKVHQYNLSNAWDLTSATYFSNLSVSAQSTLVSGIDFSANGDFMYVADYGSQIVYQYDLKQGMRFRSFTITGIPFSSNATHILVG